MDYINELTQLIKKISIKAIVVWYQPYGFSFMSRYGASMEQTARQKKWTKKVEKIAKEQSKNAKDANKRAMKRKAIEKWHSDRHDEELSRGPSQSIRALVGIYGKL